MTGQQFVPEIGSTFDQIGKLHELGRAADEYVETRVAEFGVDDSSLTMHAIWRQEFFDALQPNRFAEAIAAGDPGLVGADPSGCEW